MADISTTRRLGKARRHFRVRKKVSGTPARPRLVVTRSSRHITAQVVDDTTGHTLASASTLEADLRSADVRGTDLRRCLFLTRPQVQGAHGDMSTRLPGDIDRPAHWS